MPKLLFLLTLILGHLSFFSPFARADEGREERLIAHARYCLLNEIVLSVGAAEARQTTVCRAGELGLAFIGERSSRKSNAELAALRRYVLDGSLGESYSCYVLAKGRQVIPLLKALDYVEQRRLCEMEVGQRLRELGIASNVVDMNAVCTTATAARDWVKEISHAALRERNCSEHDW